MAPIVVDVGKQRWGVTFRLSPRTQVMLASRLDKAPPPASSVYLSFDTEGGFERLQEPAWTQVVMLLTGFSADEIRDQGGFTFVSPVESEVLFESRAA